MTATTPTTASASTDPRIKGAWQWLLENIDEHKFADVQISISLHAGKISKLNKSLTDKFI